MNMSMSTQMPMARDSRTLMPWRWLGDSVETPAISPAWKGMERTSVIGISIMELISSRGTDVQRQSRS